MHYGDLTGTGLRRALETVDPDDVYNLGVSKVAAHLIEAVRDHVSHGG